MKPVVFEFNFVSEATGPIFGGESDDLDFTLVQWHAGTGVSEHVSGEVDVLMIVVAARVGPSWTESHSAWQPAKRC